MRYLVHQELDVVLGRLAVGDVGDDAHHALRLAVGPAGNHLAAAAQPQRGAVGMTARYSDVNVSCLSANSWNLSIK